MALAVLYFGFGAVKPAIAEKAKTKESEPVKITASMDYNSKYVFRGFTFFYSMYCFAKIRLVEVRVKLIVGRIKLR